jgi:hypothetical protein
MRVPVKHARVPGSRAPGTVHEREERIKGSGIFFVGDRLAAS